MNLHGHDIAVCSWSLQPTGIAQLVAFTHQLRLEHVQLSLGPLLALDQMQRKRELEILKASGLKLTAATISFAGEDYATINQIRRTGGYVPNEDWPQRQKLSVRAAALAASLGVKMLSTHIGFVPTEADPGYAPIKSRVREIAESFRAQDVELLLETGQEPAAELLAFLHDLQSPNVFINFDPANMILYGLGDPIAAVKMLAPFIRHVHVKDATASSRPGLEWGKEVPFGTGQVGPNRFLDALHSIHYAGPLAIEREAGNNRLGDIGTAIENLRVGVSP